MRSINIYSVDKKSNLEFTPFQRAPGQISWSEPQWSIYLNSPVTYPYILLHKNSGDRHSLSYYSVAFTTPTGCIIPAGSVQYYYLHSLITNLFYYSIIL